MAHRRSSGSRSDLAEPKFDAERTSKKRKLAPSEGWLGVNGTFNFGPANESGGQAWKTEDVWNAALGNSEFSVIASAPGADEPWASLATHALRRSGPKTLCRSMTGINEMRFQISADAIQVLQNKMIIWLERLLEELQVMSLHRVGLRDGTDAAGAASSASAADAAGGDAPDGDQEDVCVRKLCEADSEQTLVPEVSATAWTDKLQRNQMLRRIEPADVRAFLGCPNAYMAFSFCPTRWKTLHWQLLRILDEEELGLA